MLGSACPIAQAIMPDLTIKDKTSQRPYVKLGNDCLQIVSAPGDAFLRDVFQLSDGRVCSVTGASTASMERLQFGVTVLTAPVHTFGGAHAHTRLLGSAGTMYLGKSGAWELYPQERVLSGGRNRAADPDGIHCQDEATKRAAALKLIALSDEASRDYYAYVAHDQGLKCGRWRYRPMGVRAAGFFHSRPKPGEIRVPCHHNRHFLATLQNDSQQPYSVRIIVEAWYYGGRIELRASVASHAGESLNDNPRVPDSLIRSCLVRCTAG